MALHKYDEMESLIRGIHHFCQCCPDECYYWKHPNDPEIAKRELFSFDPGSCPYIIVNIGSGVSILHVYDKYKFKRIGGQYTVAHILHV